MYKKVVKNGYIVAIGTNLIGDEISDAEYNEIKSILANAPKAEGKGYKLKTDLTWEEFNTAVDDEPSADEIIDILMGENV